MCLFVLGQLLRMHNVLVMFVGCRRRILVPILVKTPCTIPSLLRYLAVVDYTRSSLVEFFWARLARTLREPVESVIGARTVTEPVPLSQQVSDGRMDQRRGSSQGSGQLDVNENSHQDGSKGKCAKLNNTQQLETNAEIRPDPQEDTSAPDGKCATKSRKKRRKVLPAVKFMKKFIKKG